MKMIAAAIAVLSTGIVAGVVTYSDAFERSGGHRQFSLIVGVGVAIATIILGVCFVDALDREGAS